jgi:NAD(P)-binding Rossmann-like domain
MAVALLSRRSQSRHSTTTIIATTTTTTTMKMKMMRLSGMLILWGVFCEIILYQGGNGTGGVALAFEIQSISHGRRQPSSSFPFPTTTTTTSTSTTSTSSSRMTDVPLHLRMRNPTGYRKRTTGSSTTTTELSLFRRIRRLFRRGKKDDASTVVPVTPPAPEVQYEKIRVKKRKSIEKDCSICIIGGGVAGLAAALTAAETLHQEPTKNKKKIILLEAGPKVGGRVQSDTTADGYTLDRGFAVFIEEYPMAKKILDYDGTCVRARACVRVMILV